MPADFTYGNSGRGILRGDHQWNVDFSLFKRFSITGSQALEFRAEAFNLLNSVYFDLPNTAIDTDGRRPGDRDVELRANRLQFGLKYLLSVSAVSSAELRNDRPMPNPASQLLMPEAWRGLSFRRHERPSSSSTSSTSSISLAGRRWRAAASRPHGTSGGCAIAPIKPRVPVIYVNDNWGRWRSDFKAIVADCRRPGRPGAPIADLLEPTSRDFFVLKPHLSGFHETPLDTLLQAGEVKTVVIVGFAADNCVFFTAAEAHMRDYRVAVPSDCCASEVDSERRHALARMRKFLDADTAPSSRLRMRR